MTMKKRIIAWGVWAALLGAAYLWAMHWHRTRVYSDEMGILFYGSGQLVTAESYLEGKRHASEHSWQ